MTLLTKQLQDADILPAFKISSGTLHFYSGLGNIYFCYFCSYEGCQAESNLITIQMLEKSSVYQYQIN